MKTARIAAGRLDSGGSGEIRTRDQRIKSPLLYQLSYRPLEKREIILEGAISSNSHSTLNAMKTRSYEMKLWIPADAGSSRLPRRSISMAADKKEGR